MAVWKLNSKHYLYPEMMCHLPGKLSPSFTPLGGVNMPPRGGKTKFSGKFCSPGHPYPKSTFSHKISGGVRLKIFWVKCKKPNFGGTGCPKNAPEGGKTKFLENFFSWGPPQLKGRKSQKFSGMGCLKIFWVKGKKPTGGAESAPRPLRG